MKKVIGFGLIGLALLAGCHGAARQDQLTSESQNLDKPQPVFPDWVEIPEWALNAQAGKRPEPDWNAPSVTIKSDWCCWQKGAPAEPRLPMGGYAILLDAERDRVWEWIFNMGARACGLEGYYTLVQGQDSWVGDSWWGFVQFLKPLAISEEEVEFLYSLQFLPRGSGGNDDVAAPASTPTKIDGRFKLSLGHWWLRCFDAGHNFVEDPRTAVFLEVVRLNHPDEPVEEPEGALSAAYGAPE